MKKKIMLPKPRTDQLKRSLSYSGDLLRTIFPRKYVHQIPYVSLREVPTDGFLISTPHGKYVKQFLRIFNYFLCQTDVFNQV